MHAMNSERSGERARDSRGREKNQVKSDVKNSGHSERTYVRFKLIGIDEEPAPELRLEEDFFASQRESESESDEDRHR